MHHYKMATKVAVVTGANKGIGYGIVKALCKKFKGTVYLSARDIRRGENAVKELEEQGFTVKFHQLDITDQGSVDQFKSYIQRIHGGLDILVNNVGMAYKMTSTAPMSEQAEETIKVNFFGLVRVCNALFPLLRSNARVVNVSSSVGSLCRIPGEALRKKIGSPTLSEEELIGIMTDYVESARNNRHEEEGWGKSAYFVSKVGVTALTFIQQRQFDTEDDQRSGICVNAVHPGFVATDMTEGMSAEWTVEQGVDAPVYLALLPTENNEIKGCFVWKDRNVRDWKAAECPYY